MPFLLPQSYVLMIYNRDFHFIFYELCIMCIFIRHFNVFHFTHIHSIFCINIIHTFRITLCIDTKGIHILWCKCCMDNIMGVMLIKTCGFPFKYGKIIFFGKIYKTWRGAVYGSVAKPNF